MLCACRLYVGGGVRRHPSSSYFRDMVLYAFDCLLIMTGERFTELEISIALECREWKVPFVLIRTKGDADVESYVERVENQKGSTATPFRSAHAHDWHTCRFLMDVSCFLYGIRCSVG